MFCLREAGDDQSLGSSFRNDVDDRQIVDGYSARSKNSLDLMLKKDGAVMGSHPREISTDISACRSDWGHFKNCIDLERRINAAIQSLMSNREFMEQLVRC